VVDVRGSDEYAAGHLRDAKHIPLADLGNRIGELDKSKTKTVIVVVPERRPRR
jgi:rhodanese-related sulfurtransferase